MESVTIPGTSRIVGRRNSNALVRRHGTGELADHPSIRDLIVKNDRVAVASGLAETTEAGPNGNDARWPKNGSARIFIEDLIAFVDHLDILGRADLAIGIRRSTVTRDARKR